MDLTVIIAILAVIAFSFLKENRKKEAGPTIEEDFKPSEEAGEAPRMLGDLVEEIRRREVARENREVMRRMAEQQRRLAARRAEKEQILREEELKLPFGEESPLFTQRHTAPTTTPHTTLTTQKTASKTPKSGKKSGVDASPFKTAEEVSGRAKTTNTEQHEALRDFDLERAVIYSEILEPKFKAYE